MSSPTASRTCPSSTRASTRRSSECEGRMVLLTFGLLGPGKGIEYVIEALPEIVRRHPNVVYLVLGATHPHLVAREGESYRLGLERLAEDRGVKGQRDLLQPLRLAGGPQGVHQARRTSISPPTSTRRRSLRARWPTSSGPARRWSRRPTGTPRNCSPTAGAPSCRSATRRAIARGSLRLPRRSRRACGRCGRKPTAWVAR